MKLLEMSPNTIRKAAGIVDLPLKVKNYMDDNDHQQVNDIIFYVNESANNEETNPYHDNMIQTMKTIKSNIKSYLLSNTKYTSKRFGATEILFGGLCKILDSSKASQLRVSPIVINRAETKADKRTIKALAILGLLFFVMMAV